MFKLIIFGRFSLYFDELEYTNYMETKCSNSISTINNSLVVVPLNKYCSMMYLATFETEFCLVITPAHTMSMLIC